MLFLLKVTAVIAAQKFLCHSSVVNAVFAVVLPTHHQRVGWCRWLHYGRAGGSRHRGRGCSPASAQSVPPPQRSVSTCSAAAAHCCWAGLRPGSPGNPPAPVGPCGSPWGCGSWDAAPEGREKRCIEWEQGDQTWIHEIILQKFPSRCGQNVL